MLVYPSGAFKQYWDYFIMVVATYNCFALPIEIAFEPPLLISPAFQAVTGLCDLIFFADMVVVFRTVVFINDKE